MQNDRVLLERAKELRKDMTPQERHLWFDFLRTRPEHWYKQRIIEHYVADFYCAKAKLIIELDGSQHYSDEQMSYDNQRTIVFQKHGLQVLRFSNFDIYDNFDGVCEQIEIVVKERQQR